MQTLKIFTEDLEVAKALLKRNNRVTKEFLYVKCYPLFKSIYDNYDTDCCSVQEFIDVIYMIILTPSKETQRCQLENFRGESTLTSWLKTVCLFYCYHSHKKRKDVSVASDMGYETESEGERIFERANSTDMDSSSIERHDVEVIIGMMSNERYRQIMRLRYLEGYTNEETAKSLGMTMANYYNKHKLAKEQFENVFRKESYND